MGKLIMDAEQMERTYRRFAMQIAEYCDAEPFPAIIGMQSRGVHLARRIHGIIESLLGLRLDFGVLDVTFYRDDFRTRDTMPEVQVSEIPFDLTDRDVVLVDDVLYTGRTVRSAMDALLAYGRPRSIRFCCMVDRGHRELPIHADMVGVELPTHRSEEVLVRVSAIDGQDAVLIASPTEPRATPARHEPPGRMP